MARVAIFTDDDFDKVNGITTAFGALLRFPAADVEPRVYTASDFAIDSYQPMSARTSRGSQGRLASASGSTGT